MKIRVCDLIKQLQKENPNDVVIIASDAEGNSYSYISDEIGRGVFADGEVHIKSLTPALKRQGFTAEDVYEGDDGEDAVVLYP